MRQQSNIGATANLKFVFEQSVGEYFIWAADDDDWSNDYVQKLVGILSANPDVALVACQTIYRLSRADTLYPKFLQGIPLMTREARSPVQRIRLAYRENFGELFYGLFRRRSLLSQRGIGVDFEKLKWYLTDVAKPLLVAAVVVSIVRLVARRTDRRGLALPF